MEPSPHEVSARIARLLVYPVKSCAGIELEQVVLRNTGLDGDRACMVVDAAGRFVSQRELPRMALIRPQLAADRLELHAPGMPRLQVALSQATHPVRVQVEVWRDTVEAHDLGDAAAHWLSGFLRGTLRLVRFAAGATRLSDLRWTGGLKAPNQFSDGYPLLLVGQASLDDLNDRLHAAGHAAVGMERFRPNIVLSGIDANDEDRLDVLWISTADGTVRIKPVKPCTRCPIPNIDQATAISNPAVTDILQTYRQNAGLAGAVTFGMNAIVVDGAARLLRVGQNVVADYRFDELS